MSRTSRIERPPGSRFLAIFSDDIFLFGLQGAAVIALLDFFDRAHGVGGQPTASRARILADLQGFIGRNSVDVALTQLLKLGVIKKHVGVEMGEKNYTRNIFYSINSPALSAILQGNPETGSSGDSLFRELRGLPVSVPEQGVPSICVKEERSSSSSEEKILSAGGRKAFNLGPAGLHIWTPADRLAADQLIAEHGLDAVASTVNQMDTEPLPGRVRHKLEQLARAQRAAAKQASAAKPPTKPKAHLDIDPVARASGEALLAKIRHKKSTQNQGATP